MLPSDPLNLFFLLAPFPYDYKKEKEEEKKKDNENSKTKTKYKLPSYGHHLKIITGITNIYFKTLSLEGEEVSRQSI